MYIRIKTRKLSRRSASACTFRAMVVKCVRIEGKPRQKIVLYLGTISEKDVEQRELSTEFLANAFRKLDTFGFNRKIAVQLKKQLGHAMARARVHAWKERKPRTTIPPRN